MITYNDETKDLIIDTTGDVTIVAAKSVRVIRADFLDMRGATINGNLDMKDATIESSLDMNGASIRGYLDMSGASISGYLDMSGASIEGDVYMNRASIEDEIYMNRATINGSLDMSEATIYGIRITEPTPEEAALIELIKAEISKPGALDMSRWHTCDTTHCLAGWAQVLSGRWITEDAGADGRELIPSLSGLFYSTNEIVEKYLGVTGGNNK